MPRGNKTGPVGFGPQTGRRMGYCAGYETPGFMQMNEWNQGMHRGAGNSFFSRRRGKNIGRGRFYPMPENAIQGERELLENQVTIMREQLNALEKQLDELEKQK